MKRLFLLLLVAILSTSLCNAAPVKCYARSGQMVTLDLGWNSNNYGTIQWQSSADGKEWTDINNANGATYSFKISKESFYRAVVKGDPTCPEIIVERHVIPVSFSVTLLEEDTDNVLLEVSDLNLSDAEITEVGFTAGMSALSRDYTLLPRTRVDVGDIRGKESFEMRCTNLKPNTKYNVRVYFKTADGSLIFGAGKLAQTLGGMLWSSEDWTIEKTQIAARFKADGANARNVRFFFGSSATDMQEYGVNSLGSGLYSSATIDNLTPGAEYIAKVTAEIDGEETEITKTVRTMSDYSQFEVDNTVKPVSHVVEWDNTQFVTLSPENMQVEYPRMCRIDDQKILLTYHGGYSDYWQNSYIRKSYDNGRTWTEPKTIFDASKNFYGNGYWRICNPEMTRLCNGWILLSVVANGNPESNNNSKVLLSISKDDGETWSDPLIVGRGRTWEPQVIQMPNGEVELLVSSEAAWWGQQNLQQEILSTRSTDGGETWTAYKRAAYLPGCRDGMPVSVVMQGNKGVMFVIESVGSGLPPSLVHRTLDGEWETTPWDRNEDDRRWLTNLNAYAGAPYMIQLPTGEFLIMAHTNQTGDVWQTSRAQVVMADNTGHGFKYKRVPFSSAFPGGVGCYYNSFFQYDDDTVWLLFTYAKYSGGNRDNSAIMLMQGKIVEK